MHARTVTNKLKPSYKIIAAATCSIALFFGTAQLVTHLRPTYKKDISDATSYKPERFTELYFTRYQDLSKRIIAGQTYSGEFTIVSHEADQQDMHFRVETFSNQKLQSTQQGTLNLKPGQSTTQKFVVTTPDNLAKVDIFVSIDGKNQKLHFRTES